MMPTLHTGRLPLIALPAHHTDAFFLAEQLID